MVPNLPIPIVIVPMAEIYLYIRIWPQEHMLNKLLFLVEVHLMMLHIKALGLVVSDKKSFKVFISKIYF